jgi:hypothetical protein
MTIIQFFGELLKGSLSLDYKIGTRLRLIFVGLYPSYLP